MAEKFSLALAAAFMRGGRAAAVVSVLTLVIITQLLPAALSFAEEEVVFGSCEERNEDSAVPALIIGLIVTMDLDVDHG